MCWWLDASIGKEHLLCLFHCFSGFSGNVCYLCIFIIIFYHNIMVLSSNITWIFPDENSGSANGNDNHSYHCLHLWYCHHPGSKLWTWDSFLSPGKASSLPQCAVQSFPPRLLSWLLSVWVMMWLEFLVFTNSGGNLSCSTNLGKLLKGPRVWVLRCVSWQRLCICQRPWREDARVFWTGFAERNKGIHLRSSLLSFSAFAVKHFGQFSPRTVSNWSDIFWV